MSTTPTNNPIPSESVKDLAFNAGKIDEFVNSPEEAFSDRFGLARLTLTGIQAEADNVIGSLGFLPVDSFEAGATISSRNQSLHYLADNNYYRWDGSLTSPKVVPPGSTPASAGGVAAGAWVNVTDNTLRSQLSSTGSDLLVDDSRVKVQQPFTGALARSQHEKNKEILNIKDFGAIGDGSAHPLSERFATLTAAQSVYPFVTALTQTQDYAAIQATLNAAASNPGGGVIYIPAATSVAGGYVTKNPIIIPTFVSVYGDGIGSVIKADASLVGDVVKIDTGPTRGPMFLRDFGVVGNGTCNGFGTTITDSITEFKYIYGYTLMGLHVSNCDIGYLFQGLWHSLFANCTSGGCRVGVQFRGQNVSVLTTCCHFRRDSAALANSIGIDILPYHYAFQASGALAQSEALIVSGETMCIGQYIGIWVHGGLDFHFSNLDLDYIGFTGIRVDEINALLTISDSWIAADVSGTGQFIGINFQSQVVGQPKVVRGVNVTNRTPAGGETNIGIQAIGSAYLNVTDCNLSGTYSLYLKNWNTANIIANNLGSPYWFENNQNCITDGNSISSVVYSNPNGYLTNSWGVNPGVQTFGVAQITMAPSATVSSLSISGLINGAKYGISQEHVDATDKSDTVEIAGNTITVRRAAPSSAFQIDAYVRYRIIK